MKRSYIAMGILAAAALGACQSSKVRVSGRFVGTEPGNLYVERIAGAVSTVVDSVELDAEGNFRFSLEKVPPTPTLYQLSYGGERIPLLLEGGDRLTLSSAGSVARNYTVEGSEESALLCDFSKAYVAGAERLRDLSAEYVRSAEGSDDRQRLAEAYTEEYLRIKRAQLRFIIEHKGSVAAVYALSQRLPGDQYLFNGPSDVVYYREVAEALEERYPESPYLTALHTEMARLEALQSLQATVSEAGYPDIELADMYGRKVRLSSLAGQVILLDFWSPSRGNSNALNADLRALYGTYHDAGFEVYQVALESAKPAWIAAVQEQALPWISVCDFRGEVSPLRGLYNVQRLPANYLIDREGNIVARDLYGGALEGKLKELL